MSKTTEGRGPSGVRVGDFLHRDGEFHLELEQPLPFLPAHAHHGVVARLFNGPMQDATDLFVAISQHVGNLSPLQRAQASRRLRRTIGKQIDGQVVGFALDRAMLTGAAVAGAVVVRIGTELRAVGRWRRLSRAL